MKQELLDTDLDDASTLDKEVDHPIYPAQVKITRDFLLEVVSELSSHFRIVTGELLVAVFGVDVFCNRDRRLLGVEDKRSLSFGGESRVVTEQCPVTGIHGHLLVLKLAVEIETVVDAGAVADDQRRTTVSWRRQLSSCRRRREHKSVALSLLQLTCAVV